ncbi:hypothetical protein G5V59_07890 [Nocardioides sp. W3-2-3]|uniref:PP2C family protein-serine/threonine phosphatase n=1 Tax=Nocardioides convexus TaxID=2712224 RepID=UPI0024188C51|nr:protein phosphatase 2C domain-containing protein [Nocardioides convexus]NHA00116.1 hypothetical protein [Nocardioides convexus]
MRGNATGAETWSSPESATGLVYAAGSHPGRVRTVNEDSSLVAPPIFLVADGMGGYARGDVASRLVAESFEPLAALSTVQPRDVEAAIGAAQRQVAALASEFTSAPGSTLVAAAYVLQDGHAYWLLANIGDSRVYSWTDGVLEQISKDHSVIQEPDRRRPDLPRRGAGAPRAARRHPRDRRADRLPGRLRAGPGGGRLPAAAVLRRAAHRVSPTPRSCTSSPRGWHPTGPWPPSWRRPSPRAATTTSRSWWSTSWASPRLTRTPCPHRVARDEGQPTAPASSRRWSPPTAWSWPLPTGSPRWRR